MPHCVKNITYGDFIPLSPDGVRRCLPQERCTPTLYQKAMWHGRKIMADNETILDMDSLTSAEVFPSVSENAIAAVEARQEKAAKEAATPEPVKYNKDGSIAKKRGRKAGQETKKDGFKNPREETPKFDNTGTAVTISGILEGMQATLISKEFTYTDAERAFNVMAWKGALDHYDVGELHPLATLGFSHAQIIVSRAVGGTETKTKLQKLALSAKEKWFKFRGRKNALLDSRKNNERENDMGKEESSKPKKEG